MYCFTLQSDFVKVLVSSLSDRDMLNHRSRFRKAGGSGEQELQDTV